jgi:hypothetical protein
VTGASAFLLEPFQYHFAKGTEVGWFIEAFRVQQDDLIVAETFRQIAMQKSSLDTGR